MKRRIIVLAGIVSPLILLALCVLVTVPGVVRLSLIGDEADSRIVRIVSLAPLTTPLALQHQNVPLDNSESDQPETLQGEFELTEEAEVETQPEVVEASVPVAQEEAEQAPAAPPVTASSLLLEGVANRIVIPKLNLAAPIVDSPIENQTWKVDHLGQTIGHLEGTAAPGSGSNAVYAAHVTISRDVFGPFANLSQLAPGDIIYVYEGDREFQYIVDDAKTVERTAIEVTHASDDGRITLITCSNWDEAAGRYAERLIVKGRLAEG